MKCLSTITVGKERNEVGCGKCMFCLQRKRADWTFRILQELKVCSSAMFVTWTYDEENVPYLDVDVGDDDVMSVPTLVKSDFQLMMKRLRHETENVLRYYAVGEYGTQSGRPHYHAILFNLPTFAAGSLDTSWKKGFVHVGQVELASVHYVTKYVVNRVDFCSPAQKPFALISNRSGGIGKNYLATHTAWHRAGKRTFGRKDGRIVRLPRYYADRIFTQEERKAMRMEYAPRMTEDFRKELLRLGKYHDDPYVYRAEALAWEHESLRRENLKSNMYAEVI